MADRCEEQSVGEETCSNTSLKHLSPPRPLGSSVHSEGFLSESGFAAASLPESYVVCVLLSSSRVLKEQGLAPHAQQVGFTTWLGTLHHLI